MQVLLLLVFVAEQVGFVPLIQKQTQNDVAHMEQDMAAPTSGSLIVKGFIFMTLREIS